MNTLDQLVLAISGLFVVGSIFRISILAIQMSMAEDKSAYLLKIKHVLIAFVISLIVGTGAAFNNIIISYFK